MADHSERDHATWSASATERNWNCPGALALTKDLPESTSEAADWGTCCHQIAEACLREDRNAYAWIGETVKGKKFSFECDDEMAETTQTYVDYVRGRLAEYENKTGHEATLFIEQKFSLAALNPPFEAGGTGDAVMYFPKWELLEVADLKGGRGVRVSATENKQLRTYGLGAMLANRSLAVKTVMSTIVQPRTSPAPKSEEYHVADLLEWTGELLEAMTRSHHALVDFHGNDAEDRAEWQKIYLSPGDHCGKTFCKAAGFCPALRQQAYDKAGVWFDDLDQPGLANSPSDMSPEMLAQALDAADMIGDWISAVRAYAHAQAEMGVEIPEYQLVEKTGPRKWNEGVSIDDVREILIAAGKDGEAAYAPPKPASPAQVEKALGAKHKADVAALIHKPITGTNLVRCDKTTRPAAAPAVAKHFDILD